MSENAQAAYDAIHLLIGNDPVAGDWFQVDQDRIQAFADATLDHQFIHLDPERAAQTPFGGTIAHGFLTLSLLVHLSTSIPSDLPPFNGVLMGVNYRMNKVRFVNPVPSGSRVRATAATVPGCPITHGLQCSATSTNVRGCTSSGWKANTAHGTATPATVPTFQSLPF